MSRRKPPSVRMAKRMLRMGIAMQNTKITLCSCRESIKFRADHCELEGLPVTGAAGMAPQNESIKLMRKYAQMILTKWTTQNGPQSGQNESIVYVQIHCINTFRPLAS